MDMSINDVRRVVTYRGIEDKSIVIEHIEVILGSGEVLNIYCHR